MAQLPKVAWIALTGLAGCGAHVDGTEPTTSGGPIGTPRVADPPTASTTRTGDPAVAAPTSAVAAVDENLARLRALNIFEVGDLVVQMPAEALNCYGPKPCAGSETAVAGARAEAALRLSNFANAAGIAATEPYDSYACVENIDRNLGTLRALSIVEIGVFLETQPANNANCYNLPCQSDIDAANADNHARAAALENIAISLPEL